MDAIEHHAYGVRNAPLFIGHRIIVHGHLKHCSLAFEQWCVGARRTLRACDKKMAGSPCHFILTHTCFYFSPPNNRGRRGKLVKLTHIYILRKFHHRPNWYIVRISKGIYPNDSPYRILCAIIHLRDTCERLSLLHLVDRWSSRLFRFSNIFCPLDAVLPCSLNSSSFHSLDAIRLLYR